MAAMNSIRDTFFEECEELLEALADGLALMQAGENDAETMNAVFRAVHSIKGGAGAFGLGDLVAFAHRFETVLDEVRSGRIELDPEAFRVLFRSADHLTDLVAAAKGGTSVDKAITDTFITALDDCLEAHDIVSAAPEGDFSFSAVPLDLSADFLAPADPAAAQGFEIRLRPLATLYASGNEPAWLIRALGELGTVDAKLDLSALPDWQTMDLASPALGWDLQLLTDAGEAAVRDVFEFVSGHCELRIAVTLPKVAAMTLAVPPPADAAGPVLPVPPQGAAQRLPREAPVAADVAPANPTLRVDLDRVDRLINAVGELITNQAAIAQRVDEMSLATGAEIKAHVEDYRHLARDVQEAVMAIRAQPVKPLFQRMARIVREAADATGKSARFVTSGDNVEVDKTVIERLADPLTHMIRNSVDHGLEPPEDRLAAGKDATGTITLAASHRSGRVHITIRDDGAGLNRPKILAIAVKKGLVPPDAELSDAEIDALLFLPGFSTAATISNLSGRGVGLDVVRTAVAGLGGRITITTVPGQGSEFTISVPLTLAVMDGMVISVAGQTMVVPIASILETIRPEPDDIHHVGPTQSLLAIRGRFVPIIDVARELGLDPRGKPQTTPLLLLVEAENLSQCALAVDDVFDQRQVVIKGLDSNYGSIAGVSAATVLGNGQIALILDTDAVATGRDLAPIRPRPISHAMEGTQHGTA
ncbi:MAG: chemotaxis protein CheA [Rhodobacterales bacterium 32-66-7]|nr:MAG: chemotaxis protein CheA [Rhodobacterales bacterium 32-66-7]